MAMPGAFLKASREDLLAEQCHQQLALRLEGFAKVSEDLEIVVGIFEVPEGAEEIEGEVKGFRTLEMPHILLNKLDLQAFKRGEGSGILQIPRRPVHARHPESPAGESKGVSPRPTAQV